MNSIPAKLAKVKRLVLATPKVNGKYNPGVLYAAKKVGIKEIYSMGGAQAIASLAYIQKVNKIVGPGNKFVAEAKKQLSGKLVGTESMFAGASEICVLADKHTDINQIVTSMVSQAEHDEQAQPILITDSHEIAAKVEISINNLLRDLPRAKIARSSWSNNGAIIFVKNMEEAIELVNFIAPEHLELIFKNAKKSNYLKKCKKRI